MNTGIGWAHCCGTIALMVLFFSVSVSGAVIVGVIDEDLDMAKQIESYESVVESETGTSPVEYGPRLAVGQGEDASNYTLVKILNKFQICELQFLAYPSTVRGGVNVSAGQLFSDEMAIATCPISNTSTRQIRLFSQAGDMFSIFEPDSVLTAPFVIAVGDFVPGNDGDEIAVASRNQNVTNRNILMYSGEGVLLSTISTPYPYSGSDDTLMMSVSRGASGEQLLLYFQAGKKAILLDPSTGQDTDYNLNTLPDNSGVHESAFEDQLFVAGAPEALLSTMHIVDRQGDISSVDAGRRENSFWIASYYDAWSDSQYIKNSRFRHIRTDQNSDNYLNPDFSSDNYSDWVGSSANANFASLLSNYHTSVPAMWEPTYTHRHHATVSSAWLNEIDPNTGLNKYMMLSRLDNPVTYGEGSTVFNCLTYAPGLPAIDHLYNWPQRAFLRQLASYFRGEGGHAEYMVGVEPSHEFEIISGGDSSIGDYNPKMISGFYAHLVKRYKVIGRVNELYGTSFSAADFDAPRNLERGSWDAYDTGNGFYNEWVEYNRKVIFHRLAQGFREALIAGFPPEAIKTHQIPEGYAVSPPISGFRISPVDWIFTAGTGYGGTRYGIWYTNSSNWIQGAFSSGQTMTSIGEYDPMTTSQSSADNQLSYLFNNGVNFIHCMGISDDAINRNAGLSLQDDGPRPGTTGGIGQIRAVVQPTDNGGKPYNIICVGTGQNRQGLLKSVNAYGNWEGTVYVIPFHSAVTITPKGTEDRSFHLTTAQFSSGTITGLMAGDQIEIRFRARTANSNGMTTLLVLHEGMEIQRHHIDVSADWGFNRYVLRIQSAMRNVLILMNSGKRDTSTAYNQDIEIEDFSVLIHKEQVARKQCEITAGTPHSGGVMFDVLSPSHRCGLTLFPGDLNLDCRVDFEDLSILASNWLIHE